MVLGRYSDRARSETRAEASAAELFWSRRFEGGELATWLSVPRVRQYVNELITGSPHEWPMDCFQRLYVTAALPRGLSVGCGQGALERDVRRKNICRKVLGLDLSRSAIESARSQARRERLSGVRYKRSDFNDFRLPRRRFDIVFFHQSMHHVSNLEHCIEQVRRTLKPSGFLFLDEYVGPSRDEWTVEHLEAANAVYRQVPAELRTAEEVLLPIEMDDPSEAVRSSEIVPLVRESFDVLHQRDYGGNVLALLYPIIDWRAMSEETESRILERLIEEERQLLSSGETSYYSVILATHGPRPGVTSGP